MDAVSASKVDLVRAEDHLLAASRAIGGFMELLLSLPDTQKISITRGKLYSLLAPVENGLIEAHLKVKSARKSM